MEAMDKRSNHLYSENTSISIHNSPLAFFYQIRAPFQLTYEFCSGSNDDDYINFITLSPESSSYGQESAPFHSFIFQNAAPHFHDYYEFMLVLDGEVIQRIEGQDHVYRTGSCCLINRSLFHKENFNGTGAIVFIGISVDMMQDLLNVPATAYFNDEHIIAGNPLLEFIQDDLQAPGRKAYLDFTPLVDPLLCSDYFHRITQALINALLFPRFGSSNIVRGVICQLFQRLSSEEVYQLTIAGPRNTKDFLLFTHINNLIEQRMGRISRQDLEASLHYNADYMNRIVKKYTGMNLFHFCMTFRLREAGYMLIHSDKSIAQIVADLGFTNRTHFYSLFKQQYRVTPQEYRTTYRPR